MKKLIFFLFIALLFIPKANAEVISDGSEFVVQISNNNIPYSFWLDSTNVSTKNVYLYNYSGISKPYTYVIFSICSNVNTKLWITNGSYTNYFRDGAALQYNEGDSCIYEGYVGSRYLYQIQVGVYEDLDDTGAELVASSNLNFQGNQTWGGFVNINNVYLSSTDLLTNPTQNQALLNQILGTNSKLDSTNQKLDEANDNIKDLDDTINNSNIDNPDFEEFEEYLASNGVITQLITLPVRLYSQILTNINGSCNDFQLGSLFGTNLIMTCIVPQEYIGSTLWNTIDVLFSGFFIFSISKKMVKVFEQFTNLEEGDILD